MGELSPSPGGLYIDLGGSSPSLKECLVPARRSACRRFVFVGRPRTAGACLYFGALE